MINILYSIVVLWVGWLLLNGLLTGTIWVKGGTSDRFTRSLDMQSFAHKVSREDNPRTYWFNVAFYTCVILLIFYAWLVR